MPPAVIAEAPPSPPRDPELLDLLDADSTLRGKTCLVAPGLPSLFIDPHARQWHADASLKALAGWCTRALAPGDVQTMSDGQFATAVATLPGHPHARLTWLAHLVRGAGQLAPGLDPDGHYRLARWPQSEREFPKHFRIATVMLKQAAPVEEIAEQSGASRFDVADFINAYHALGFVEHDYPGQGARRARAAVACSAAEGKFRRIRLTNARAITILSRLPGAIAQLGERYNGIVEVGGSIPPGSTKSVCDGLLAVVPVFRASPSSRGLGHRPFTAVTGVRIPLGTPIR